MNLATLEIDPAEAKERLTEYRSLIASERTAEDEAIAMGYRAAARGLPVISLPIAMATAGFFPNGLPKLAIIRADAVECRVDVSRWRSDDKWSVVFGDVANYRTARSNRGAIVGTHTVRLSLPPPPPPTEYHSLANSGATIVPIIPPRHRPKKRRLAHTHVLWEVEEWKRVAPKDPALLRHIRGDLWAVLAVWDLTELERAVLTQRVS